MEASHRYVDAPEGAQGPRPDWEDQFRSIVERSGMNMATTPNFDEFLTFVKNNAHDLAMLAIGRAESSEALGRPLTGHEIHEVGIALDVLASVVHHIAATRAHTTG